eukprot:403338042
MNFSTRQQDDQSYCMNVVIKCPHDLTISTIEQNPKDHMQTLVSLKQSDSLNAICDTHVKQKATLYCTNCKALVCFHCKQDTHKEHPILEIKKSGFTKYAENVTKLLEEYSVKNIKALLISQTKNRSQFQIFQLKQLLNNAKTILGNLVTEEEQKQIDIAYYSEEYQRYPQQIQGLLNRSEEQKQHSNLNIEEFQTMINQSHQQLREEFKNGFRIFENNQIKISNKMNEQINISKKQISNYSAQLDEFKREVNTQLKNQDQSRIQKDQSLESLYDLVVNIKSRLEHQVKNQSEILKQSEQKEASLQQFTKHQKISSLSLNRIINRNYQTKILLNNDQFYWKININHLTQPLKIIPVYSIILTIKILTRLVCKTQ